MLVKNKEFFIDELTIQEVFKKYAKVMEDGEQKSLPLQKCRVLSRQSENLLSSWDGGIRNEC